MIKPAIPNQGDFQRKNGHPMIDTHCHLDLPIFDPDRSEVLQRARQAGVETLVLPGIRLADFPRLTALAGPSRPIALGLHPLHLDQPPLQAIEELEQWIRQSTPIALGEMGLDHRAPVGRHAEQYAMLVDQLHLAGRYGLPVLLHVVKAHDAVLALLRRTPLPSGGIVHAFNGSLSQAHAYLDLGFRLGFGGVVTRERSKKIRQVAAALPDDALVLETDAPDLPPAGFEGQRNEPAHLGLIVETLATLRKVSKAQVVETTRHNTETLLFPQRHV